MLFIFVGYAFMITDFNLPYNLMFLPYQCLPFPWATNYLFQLAVAVLGTLFLLIYWPLVLISMNHSRYVVDVTMLHVKALDTVFDIEDSSQKEREIKNTISKIIETCCEIVGWQNQARKLLKFDFLLEFIMLTLITCLSASTFTSEVNPMDFFQLSIGTSQLLVYCLMGSMVESRFKMLATALYNIKWDLLSVRRQKDLQMTLTMMQNVRSFDGIFDTVDLDTFTKVRTEDCFE